MEKDIIKQNVGIDISKDDFKVCFSVMHSNLQIKILGSRTFVNSYTGFKEFLIWTKSKRKSSDTVYFTLEATGVYYEGLSYFLWKEPDFKLCVVLPNKVKNYSKSLDFKSKTDKIDAQILSRFGLERDLRVWQPISGNLLELKQLTRERDTLVRSRTAAANQLHATEHQGKPNKKIIARTKKHIVLLDKQVKEIEKEIKTVVNQDDKLKKKFAYLQSIPGVGLLTAACIVAETNGFETFTSIKQLTSYAGLDVRIVESGKWKGESHISKRGNSHIRKALYMPSISRINCDKWAKQFYQNLKDRKGQNKSMVALVAVQRKMLGLMFSLWKNEQMYDKTK
jgi:transposase